MEADFLIVGAGCSGLSLAAHLVQVGLGARKLIVVDPRPRDGLGRDRTWCSFAVERHLFERAVTHVWPRWIVRAPGREILRGSSEYPYRHVPADAFYREALGRIEGRRGVELRFETRVQRLVERDDRVIAELAGGGSIETRIALDSRPVPLPREVPEHSVRLLQHFRGWFVEADHDAFDPETATLMDFDVPQDPPIHFLYVLPFSPRRALVEATWFSEQLLEERVYDDAVAAYLARRWPDIGFETESREQGVLPMTTEAIPARPSPRVYRLGLAGGAAKPSTGYAFAAIQRFSRQFAPLLVSEDLPEPPPYRTPRGAFLDAVFLSYLRRHPDRAPGLFADMFERIPAEPLVRFLSEVSSPLDDIKVMRALPALPLALETVRSHRTWRR